ncbi:MAG: amidohydrolase family protein, partial [Steroidobacteraceae bacterium]
LAAASDTLLIQNATLYTAAPEETAAQTNMDIRVEGGVITQVGEDLPTEGVAQVIDAAGRAVTPGVFGGIGRIGLEEIGLEKTTGDYAQRLEQMRPEFDVTLAFNPEAMSLGVHLKNGLTFSVLAPASARGGSLVAGLGAATALDGRLPTGPRVMFVDLGGDANDLSGGSRAAQFMLLRQAFVEAKAPNLVMVHDERLLSPSGRQVLVDFIKNQGVFVFDVDRAIDIQRTIDFARSEGVRAVIRGGAEAWRVAAQLASAKIPVILDPLENLPDSFDSLGATLENAARLHQAGVQIAISLGSPQVQNAGKTRQAAGNAVAHGLPWHVGLAAITRTPAEIFGVADQFGRISVGRKADLVMWSGDPLDVSSLPDLVLSNGREHPLESRHSALRDRHYERVRQGLAR